MKLVASDAELCTLIYEELALSPNDETTIEEAGRTLPSYVLSTAQFAFPPAYWKNLKNEFRLLVCTSDKKYAPLRKELGLENQRSQTVIVSMIAVALAHSVGVAAGTLTPFCALCLLALARMGKEAFCKSLDFDVPVRPKKS